MFSKNFYFTILKKEKNMNILKQIRIFIIIIFSAIGFFPIQSADAVECYRNTFDRSIEICNRSSCSLTPYSMRSARDGYSLDQMYVRCEMTWCSIPRGPFFSRNELEIYGNALCTEIELRYGQTIPRKNLKNLFFRQGGESPNHCAR